MAAKSTTKTKKETPADTKIPVMVTTEFKGVFFGYIKPEDTHADKLTLTNARNCIYWAESVKGVFGLAANGPNGSCKIGPKVEELLLSGITSVSKVSPAAAEKWEDAKWSQ